jgi:hypothetical protein
MSWIEGMIPKRSIVLFGMIFMQIPSSRYDPGIMSVLEVHTGRKWLSNSMMKNIGDGNLLKPDSPS